MRKGVAVILLLAAMLLPRVMLGVENERQLAWGVNAVVLKSPWSGAPSMDNLLADQEHTVSLN